MRGERFRKSGGLKGGMFFYSAQTVIKKIAAAVLTGKRQKKDKILQSASCGNLGRAALGGAADRRCAVGV